MQNKLIYQKATIHSVNLIQILFKDQAEIFQPYHPSNYKVFYITLPLNCFHSDVGLCAAVQLCNREHHGDTTFPVRIDASP